MTSEWVKCVSVANKKDVWVNLANAFTIQDDEDSGARIWFRESDVIDVIETAKEILDRLEVDRNANRS